MKFYINTLNDNGSGMKYNTKEEFLNELALMIDDCIDNGGTYFDVSVDADASCFYQDECECPLGGDQSNDCADCPYSDDYHLVNGECVARGYENTVCDRGGDCRNDCENCAGGIINHCVNGECVRRKEETK